MEVLPVIQRTQIRLSPFCTVVTIDRHSHPEWQVPGLLLLSYPNSPPAESPPFLAGLAHMLPSLRNQPLPGTLPPPIGISLSCDSVWMGLHLTQTLTLGKVEGDTGGVMGSMDTPKTTFWVPGTSGLPTQQILNPLLLVHPPEGRLCQPPLCTLGEVVP